jgi:hypothetical protein
MPAIGKKHLEKGEYSNDGAAFARIRKDASSFADAAFPLAGGTKAPTFVAETKGDGFLLMRRLFSRYIAARELAQLSTPRPEETTRCCALQHLHLPLGETVPSSSSSSCSSCVSSSRYARRRK